MSPKKSQGKKKAEPRINLRVEKALLVELERLARDEGISLSDLGRRILIDGARERGAPLDKAGRRSE